MYVRDGNLIFLAVIGRSGLVFFSLFSFYSFDYSFLGLLNEALPCSGPSEVL